MTIARPGMTTVAGALCATLAGCALQAFHSEPPAKPLAMTPQIESVLPIDTPVMFVWQPSENASWYDFHIFDQTTRDIERYYREFLEPDSVCEGDVCQLELTLTMPVADGHAWRVRAGNNAGNSEWTRHLFAINGEAFDKPTAGKPSPSQVEGEPARAGALPEELQLEQVELLDEEQIEVGE